jgi:uncharacterized protein DUF6980
MAARRWRSTCRREWCGKDLPAGLRKAWFDILDELGLEPDDPRVPEEMKSGAWWRARKP